MKNTMAQYLEINIEEVEIILLEQACQLIKKQFSLLVY